MFTSSPLYTFFAKHKISIDHSLLKLRERSLVENLLKKIIPSCGFLEVFKKDMEFLEVFKKDMEILKELNEEEEKEDKPTKWKEKQLRLQVSQVLFGTPFSLMIVILTSLDLMLKEKLNANDILNKAINLIFPEKKGMIFFKRISKNRFYFLSNIRF